MRRDGRVPSEGIAADRGRVALPDSSLRGRRLLVVEDEYFWAEELSASLQRAGALVLGPVATIGDALAVLEADAPPDAAILDMNLRGRRAYDVADRLIALAVPFLILTGYDAAALPDAYAAVIRLEKPVALDVAVQAAAALIRLA